MTLALIILTICSSLSILAIGAACVIAAWAKLKESETPILLEDDDDGPLIDGIVPPDDPSESWKKG